MGKPRSDEGNRQVEVFNLTPYLESLGIGTRGGGGGGVPNEQKVQEKKTMIAVEKVRDIILETTAFAMRGQGEEGQIPETRFHPGANLLVIVGSPKAIEVAGKVVTALNQPAPNAKYPGPIRDSAPDKDRP